MRKNRGSGQPRHVVVAREDNGQSVAALTWAQILRGQALKKQLAEMVQAGRDFLVEITFPAAYPTGRDPLKEQRAFFHIFRSDEVAALLELMEMFRAFQKLFGRQVTPAEITTFLATGQLVLVPEGDAAERPAETGDREEKPAMAAAEVPVPIVTSTNGSGPDDGPVTPFGGGPGTRKRRKTAEGDE
ncbi:hypothetical protein [Nitrosomonas nitrosa]|uniref:hypothetical protein n=1 Tax=Nitrosomonas nitrosa TaxID=52442 RepID=UPI0023F98E14|nr:hypothetical protein [Nitrosomonas nitrosa]MCO6432800.1 hypothetical protein [Nitrosomonas nitrosa]